MIHETQNQAQKYFLVGTVILGVLIIVGIIWALTLAPDTTGHEEEYGLRFNDQNDPIIGKADSKVVVRFFSDFQCPACKSAEPGVLHILQTFADRVKFVWNDFPLTELHKNANEAANAARCAKEQGKFWEYRDALYVGQDEWSALVNPDDTFSLYAQKIGLRTDAFNACVQEKTFNKHITDDFEEGTSNNVNSTPTFFIGNKRYVGAMSNAAWDTELLSALGAVK